MDKLLVKKGMTLIEMLIAISLLGLVLLISISYYFYGTYTYQEGNNLAIVQENTRTTGLYINSEIGNAIHLEFAPKSDTFNNPGFKGLRITGTRLQGFNTDNTQISPNIQATQNIVYRLENQPGERIILHYVITGVAGKSSFEYNGSTVLLNSDSTLFFTNADFESQYELASYNLYYKLVP